MPSHVAGTAPHAGRARFALAGAPRLTPLVSSRRGSQALRPVLDLFNQTQPPRFPSWLPRLRVPVWALLAAVASPVPPGVTGTWNQTDQRTLTHALGVRTASSMRNSQKPPGRSAALGGRCQA